MTDKATTEDSSIDGGASVVDRRVRALPAPGITTALVLDEVGRHIPMNLIGAYYTADQMLEYAASVAEECDLLRAWVDEALSYVGCTTWSPSLEAEGRALLRSNDQVEAKDAGGGRSPQTDG